MAAILEQAAPTAANDRPRTPQGSHIWYELMTIGPGGAKRFYEAVIPGMMIGDRLPGDQDYRIINRSDGGSLGGVFGLKQEQLDHGVMKPIPPVDKPEGQSDVFHPTEDQRVSWNELATADPVAARQFYGDLFGWTSEEFMPMGEHGEYRFFAHQGTTIGAVSGCVQGAPAGWRYYIRIPSISKAAEAVKANGGSIAMGPMEVPGGDHIIIGHDPQGAEFALVGKQ